MAIDPCVLCGGRVYEEHGHTRCGECHEILETCCEGGPGTTVVQPMPQAAVGIAINRVRRELCEACEDKDPATWEDTLCRQCHFVMEREHWSAEKLGVELPSREAQRNT